MHQVSGGLDLDVGVLGLPHRRNTHCIQQLVLGGGDGKKVQKTKGGDPEAEFPPVPAARWWLSGNVKLGLIWGSVVRGDIFVLVRCAFCMLGNVHLMFLEVLDAHLVQVQGGGGTFLATAQLTERPTEPSLSRH